MPPQTLNLLTEETIGNVRQIIENGQQRITDMTQAQNDALALAGISSQYISNTTNNPPAASTNGTVGARRTATGGVQRLIWQSGAWVLDGSAVAGTAEVQAVGQTATEAQAKADSVQKQVEVTRAQIDAGNLDVGAGKRLIDEYGQTWSVADGLPSAANGGTVKVAANNKVLVAGQQPHGVDLRQYKTATNSWSDALQKAVDDYQHIQLPNIPMLMTGQVVSQHPLHLYGAVSGGQYGGNGGIIDGATGTALINGLSSSQPMLVIGGANAGSRINGLTLRDLQLVNQDASFATARKMLRLQYVANQVDIDNLIIDGAGAETGLDLYEVWDGNIWATIRNCGLDPNKAAVVANGGSDSTNALNLWLHVEFARYMLNIGSARHIAFGGKFECSEQPDNVRIHVGAGAGEVTFMENTQFVSPGGTANQSQPFFYIENSETRIGGWLNTFHRAGANWLSHTGGGLVLDATCGWARGDDVSFAFGSGADVRLRTRLGVTATGTTKYMQLNGDRNRIQSRVRLVNAVDDTKSDNDALPALTAGSLYKFVGAQNRIEHARDTGYALWEGNTNNSIHRLGQEILGFFAGGASDGINVKTASEMMLINGGQINSMPVGLAGQCLTLIATGGAGNTTIKQSATAKLRGGVDAVLAADQSISLVFDGTAWREVGRNF